MRGVGMTTFGIHFLEEAKKHKDYFQQELNRIRLPFLSRKFEARIETLPPYAQHKARDEMKAQLYHEQLDKFLGATYVYISLKDLPIPSRRYPPLLLLSLIFFHFMPFLLLSYHYLYLL